MYKFKEKLKQLQIIKKLGYNPYNKMINCEIKLKDKKK